MLGAQTGIPLSASTEADTLKGAVAKSQVIFKPAAGVNNLTLKS